MLKQQFFHFVFALNTVSSSSALLKNSQRALRPVYIIVSDVSRADIWKCFQNVVLTSWFEEKAAGFEPIRNREIFWMNSNHVFYSCERIKMEMRDTHSLL